MIKKTLVIFTLFILLLLGLFSTSNFEQLIVVQPNNHAKKPIDMIPNRYKDRFCNMTIADINHSSQAILPNGDTLFFDDVGCLVLWLQTQPIPTEIVLWIWAKDGEKYIPAQEAWYARHEKTPMSYGFGAYQQKKPDYINFTAMQKRVENAKY